MTETTGTDPAAWLRAAITGRLELAKAAGAGEWHTECVCKGECRGYPFCERIEGNGITIYPEGGHDSDQAAHVAANDPRDTIARCETELAILDEHAGDQSEWGGYRPDGTWQERGLVCMTCGHDDGRLGVAWPCRTVRLVFTAYRYWPGYDAAWGEPERAGGMTGTGRSEN